MKPCTIAGVNRLPYCTKQEIYLRLIPQAILERFDLTYELLTIPEAGLLQLNATPGYASVEMAVFHAPHFPDPVLYGHLTDTLIGQIHILLYVFNDPYSRRFDVDQTPDGRRTKFGTVCRNLAAEEAAMKAGLAPGQIRDGLGLLEPAIAAFECFVASLGHDLFFVEPLFYHNAVTFERYGFAYQKGRRLMETIHTGFAEGGELRRCLNGATPFRRPEAANSVRLRSWAIHDGLLGQPFTDVMMYKRLEHAANLNTCPTCTW